MKKIFYLAVLAAMVLASCSDEKDEPNLPVINPDAPTTTAGVFILNQGTYNLQIEGGLTLVDYDKNQAYQNLFQKANGRSLGDTPQTAIVYGDKIYIGVYGSNTIEIIDRNDYKSIKQISLSASEGQSPRSMVAKDGKVYVSMYNGYVSRLDTLSLSIDANLKVGPNPEIMAIRGDYLYVPNSDGMNWEAGYGTTASKVNLKTFTVESTLTVGLNPTKFVSNGTDLFLLCMGNYYDINSTVYRIKDNGESEPIVEATLVDVMDNKLYYINAPYWTQDYVYGVYDINTGTKSNMLADKGVESPAAVAVDPITKDIVISSYHLDNGYTSYTTDGYVNIYNPAGQLSGSYDTGVGPVCLFFNYK